ncbi:YbaB/EbfC family nucleoid-associated protein [Actinosynnema sp. CS-041913]|uniref:YbaB/EbfC family nucleoid-associated protein n=1 Tax=Actinosynnema sp. CS-041913 TaxID=3239917 RepID=UPI003D932669
MRDFEELVREFERFRAGLRTAGAPGTRFDGMAAEIAALEATAESPDRAITVTAGPGGSVKAIRFTERALAQGAEALGVTAAGVLHQAVAAAARRQAEIVERYVGEDLPGLEQVLRTPVDGPGAAAPRTGADVPDTTVPDTTVPRTDAGPGTPATEDRGVRDDRS